MQRRIPFSRSPIFRDLLVIGGLFAFAAIVTLRWAHPGSVVYYQDDFVVFDPWNLIRKQLFVWDNYLSIAGRFRSGIVLWPQLALAGLLSRLFGQSAGQMLEIGLGFGGASAAMYAMLRAFKFARLPAFLAAFMYAWNPFTMTAVPSSFVLLWCFPIGPAVVALLVVARNYPPWRPRALAGMAFIAALPMAVVAANPGVLLMLALFCVFGFLLATVLSPSDRAGFTRWALLAACCMAVASLWWLVPTALEYLLSAPVAETHAQAVDWNVRRASMDNALRFLTSWAWGLPQYFTYSDAYDGNVLSYGSSFALAAAAVASLAFRLPSRAGIVRTSLLTALAAIFLSKGLHPPLAWINALVYKLPGSAIWREPTTKFPVIALGALALCSAAFFERVALDLRPHRARIAAGAAVVLVSAISIWPLLRATDVFAGEAPQQPSSYVRVPAYWNEAARWLNARQDAGAALVLPADGFYQATYDWGLVAVDLLPSDLIDRDVVMVGNLVYTASATDVSLVRYIDRLVSERSTDLAAALRALGIRYVVFRSDVIQPGSALTARDLAAQLGSRPAERFGKVTVFDLGPAATSVFSASDAWIEGNYTRRTPADLFELSLMLENLPRVDESATLAHAPGPPPAAFERDAADPSQKSPPAVPVRYVWSSPVRAFAGAVTDAHDVYFAVRRSDRPSQGAAYVRLPVTLPMPRAAASSLIAFANELDDTRGGIFYAANPSAVPQVADIRIGVYPSSATQYVLSQGQRLYGDTIAAAPGVVWAQFSGVRLEPGINELTLTSSHAAVGRIASGEAGLTVDTFRASLRDEALTPPAAVAPEPPIFLDSDRPQLRIATVGLSAPMSSDPQITIDALTDMPVIFAAVVEYTKGPARFRCYGSIDTAGHLDLAAAISDCSATAGSPLTADDARRVSITGVDIAAEIPPNVDGTQGRARLRRARLTLPFLSVTGSAPVVRVGSYVFRVPIGARAALLHAGSGPAPLIVSDGSDGITTGVVGTPPLSQTPEPATWSGLFPLVAASSASESFVRLRQTYSPTWLALCFGKCALLPQHYRDGGFNAWWIRGAGNVVLTNLGVLLQLVASLASALAFLALFARAVRRPSGIGDTA